MLAKFVRWNGDLCERLADRYPNYFRSRDQEPRFMLEDMLHEAIAAIPARKLLDAGSTDRPVLPNTPEYTLTGLDIEHKEECEAIYDRFVVQSIEDRLPEKQDLIYSHALIEHVPDNKKAFAAIYDGLEPNGRTYHYLPSKGHPYALVLRCVGNPLLRPLHTPPDAEVAGRNGLPRR